jgi:tRNA threonylcarbamoyladenosine biosynthesis protein TsaB
MSAAVPRFLLIETSGRAGFVAVALGSELRGLRRLEEPRRQARDLAPAVGDLLAGQGWQPREVQAVIVGRGPGSYTGLRVGITSAKTFAYATGCAVVAVETFAVVAEQVPEDVHRLDVIADAQQDKVYVQPFARGSDGWHALEPLTIRTFADWLAGRTADTWVSGPGLHRWRPSLPADLPVVEPALHEPTAEMLLRLGQALYVAGRRDDVWAVEPLYLRPSSAEEQWRGRVNTSPSRER